MTVLTASPPARAQTVGQLRVGENYRLGEMPASRVRDRPGVVAKPTDRSRLVHVQKDTLAQDCLAYYSTDAGTTWTGKVLTPPAPFPPPGSPVTLPSCPNYDGTVEWGSGNNVYTAISLASEVGGNNSVIVYRSTDAGVNWTPLVATPLNVSAGAPKIGVHRGEGAGGTDRLWVATIISNRIRVVASNNAGDTWTAPVDITGLPANVTTSPTRTQNPAELTEPIIMPNGWVAVGYRVPDPTIQGQTAPVESTLVVARTPSVFPPPATGAGWTKSNVTRMRGYIDQSGARFNGSNFPEMDTDPTTPILYIVYMEGPPPGGRQDHFIHPDVDAMFVRSTDGGATWSAPKRINDDPPGSGAPATGPAQRHPTVKVAPNRRIDVMWQDRRHGYRSPTHSHLGNGEARMGDTYYTYSVDQGGTFSPNRRISDKSQNLDVGYDHYGQVYWSWGPALAHLSNDEVLFAWQDSREGNFDVENGDIYLAKLNLQAPDTIPVQRFPQVSPSSLSVHLGRYAYQGGPQAVLNVGFSNRPISRPVIVNEGDATSALAGSVLSRAFLAPVLATNASGLNAELRAEVQRMSPLGAYVIGGEGALAPKVVSDLVAAGVPEDEIERIAGASPAETARAIALEMDRRSAAQKTAGVPAFDAAVIVNPAAISQGAAAAAMAASLRLPVLFTESGGVPAATREALAALNITTTLVIGNSSVVSDAAAASLPGAKRLGGNDTFAVSKAIVAESVARRMPTNIVYVAADGQPMDASLLGAAIARVNGLLLVTPGADVAAANQGLSDLGIRTGVDRIVVAQSVPQLAGPGYRLVAQDGGIFAFGGAGFFGSTGAIRLAQPVVGMANTPSNVGYWLVAGDGGIFAFGDAQFYGSTGAMRLAQPVVGMAPTPSGKGYWLVARDGGIFAFGDAQFYGSTGGMRLAQPIVGMARTPSGRGYWLVAADGGVFAFGDAVFRGSTGGTRLAQPVVGMASTPSGNGYWLVARDGGIFAFGDATFLGSTGGIRLASPVVGMDATGSGQGYHLTAADGGVFAFGDAVFGGSTGGTRLAQPVVGIAAGGS
ncbi:MAG: hypothetical protein ACRD0N_13225 [Acidimicrobiales bacterium]